MANTRERPVIAITMGDAAGIGPEIIVKALASEAAYRLCRPVVIGSGAVMAASIRSLQSHCGLRTITHPGDARGLPGTIEIIDLQNLDIADFTPGRISASAGRAAMEYILRASELAMKGEVKAIVTAPINKEATVLAGYGDIGHLEFLARITGAREYATMLLSGRLRVVHLSTHHALKEACSLVTRERVRGKLALIQASFRQWGMPQPRIAVAALNPHGGEGGLFGREEIEQIEPAVREAREAGIDARGPFPADSVFNRAIAGEFDVVLAMYHDQGHIPVKVHGFARSVSVALGLPFVRTSVDHGTAFDIAGRGIASSRSLEEAIKLAARLIRGRI